MKFLSWFMVAAVLAACGGTTAPVIDGGADATVDATSKDVGVSDAPYYDSGGGRCDGGACATFFDCCAGSCKNLKNDPRNCGGCGVDCAGGEMCSNGQCVSAKCEPACGVTQSCCEVNGPGPSGGPKCYDGRTCPVGCPGCQ